ncbi:hypothetical protein GCM10009838_40440 [Catenulispora subtropica]|uniref:Secreted protein n=1 Tax=Catenulispora subtropica TaxID=450798 RepID=A0ABN2RWK3_9ACTN
MLISWTPTVCWISCGVTSLQDPVAAGKVAGAAAGADVAAAAAEVAGEEVAGTEDAEVGCWEAEAAGLVELVELPHALRAATQAAAVLSTTNGFGIRMLSSNSPRPAQS